MAEYGEWNPKGAALSVITAQKEYGVSRDFMVRGIHKRDELSIDSALRSGTTCGV